jgi:hypothetical protein
MRLGRDGSVRGLGYPLVLVGGRLVVLAGGRLAGGLLMPALPPVASSAIWIM